MLAVVILAAGQGKRMRSALPKVLHVLGEKSLLAHLLGTVQLINPYKIFIVHGFKGELVQDYFKAAAVKWVKQTEQKGTGDAVHQVLPYLSDTDRVLILLGDTPLVPLSALQKLIALSEDKLGFLTTQLNDPYGYGRVCRDKKGEVLAIVEEQDASAVEKEIREVNTGIFLVPTNFLKEALPKLTNNNTQKEYYLPDIIKLAMAGNRIVIGLPAEPSEAFIGINDRKGLAKMERILQKQRAAAIMQQGVTLRDPDRFDLRGTLSAAEDVMIDVNVIIEGCVHIGKNSFIGPFTLLKDTTIGANVEIHSHCVIEGAVIGDHCRIGPYARIRPQTELEKEVHIGNFVEIKKSKVSDKTKINHLSYIGDAIIGQAVNIGAGTITCNYDGVTKHMTIIKDNVFVGSHSSLIAPVTLNEGATIGAGTVLTNDAPRNGLTLSRIEQKTIKDWKRGKKLSNKP